jgi:hypothetical protein
MVLKSLCQRPHELIKYSRHRGCGVAACSTCAVDHATNPSDGDELMDRGRARETHADDNPPPHSITSSASSIIDGGTVRPRDFAVFRSIIS